MNNNLNTRIDDETALALDNAATDLKMKKSDIVRQAIIEKLREWLYLPEPRGINRKSSEK